MKETDKGWVQSKHDFDYFKYGKHALLLEWPKSKNKETISRILQLEELLLLHHSECIIESVPAYHSLMIYFKPTQTNHDFLINVIENSTLPATKNKINLELVTIKVSYDLSVALDIIEAADHLQLTVDELIEIHSSTVYDVHFIGFLPGFLYLGGLDPRLTIPRKTTPRIRVPAGSVAIAAGQTGIYPIDSPGGWHIIGRTEISLFNPSVEIPCPILPGMQIKFDPQ